LINCHIPNLNQMKKIQNSIALPGLMLFLALLPAPVRLLAQGTAFTFQGRLIDGTNAANGAYDMRFYLRDALAGGSPVGITNTVAPVAASNGLFTVTLDFGAAAFTGASRWLEIGVRTNGSSGAYATLAPRQALTPAPYAIMAGNAASLGGQGSTAYVAKAGDTMTGALNLPQGGIKVGASQLVTTGSNVGIGTATPAAQLEVSGPTGTQERVTDITSGNSLVLQAGTGSNMKVTAYNYTTGAVPLYLGVDGANTILNSGGGNLGIGTSSPTDQVDVFSGNRKVSINQTITGAGGLLGLSRPDDGLMEFFLGGSAAPNDDLVLFGSGGGGEMRFVSGGGGSTGFGFYLNSPLAAAFGSARPTTNLSLKIDGGGNLGIGTASPTAKLNVVGPGVLGSTFQEKISNGNQTLSLGANSTAAEVQSQGAVPLYLNHGGNNVILVDSGSGRVGINTANPANELSVNGTADVAAGLGIGTNSPFWPLDVRGAQAVGRFVSTASGVQSTIELANFGSPTTAIGAINFNTAGNSYPGQIAYGVTDGMTFRAGGTERMRIGFDGSVGINTATPGYSLDVNGNMNVTLDAHFQNNVFCNVGYYWCNFNGTYYALTKDAVGDNNGPAAWVQQSSDSRLKENITTIPNAVQTVRRLRGVTWNWNELGLEHLTRNIEKTRRALSGKPEDDQKLWATERKVAREKLSKQQMGFVAQEVEKVFPDWVSADDKGYKQINVQRLNAVLVNAIKEQQDQIEVQQREIAELKSANRTVQREWEERLAALEKTVGRLGAKSEKTFAADSFHQP
jgi:Chaperone of endosialidase